MPRSGAKMRMPKVVAIPDDSADEQEKGPSVKVSTLRNVVTYLTLLRQAGYRKTEAAQSVEKSPEAIRNSIRTVEEVLGIALTEKESHAAKRVTPAGEAFIADATNLIRVYDEVFSPTAYGIRRVKVGAYPSIVTLFFGRRVFPRLFNPPAPSRDGPRPVTFPANFPLYQLEVTHSGGRERIIHQVEQRALDFGIVDRDATQTRREWLGNKCDWLPLFESAPFGFLHTGELAPEGRSDQRSVRLKDIVRRTLFLNEHDLPAVTESLLAAPEYGVAVRCCVSSYSEVYEAVASGSGIGLGFMPQGAVADGPVKFLPLQSLTCEGPKDRRVVKSLLDRGQSSFGVCVRKDWKAKPSKGGLPDAARFVLTAVMAEKRKYVHDYVT